MSAQCATILQEAGLQDSCAGCPKETHALNDITYATFAVGGVSVTAVFLLIIAMVTHGRIQRSQQDRILLGVMIGNVSLW